MLTMFQNRNNFENSECLETIDTVLIWTARCLLSIQQPLSTDVRRWTNSWMAYRAMEQGGTTFWIEEGGDPNSVEYDLRYEMLGYYIPPQYIPVSRITKPTKVYKANNSIHLRMVQCMQPLIVARLSDKCMSHAKLCGGNVISLGSWKSWHADRYWSHRSGEGRDSVPSNDVIVFSKWHAIIYAQYNLSLFTVSFFVDIFTCFT
jgi:hypothetical protein